MSVDWVYVFSVVLTGLVVVFMALVILIIAVKSSSIIVRKIENYFNQKQNNSTRSKQSSKPKKEQEQVGSPCEFSKENPSVVEDGIDEDTVAAITAAINMMSDNSGVIYKIKGIKRKKTAGASVWGKTGILENTRAF